MLCSSHFSWSIPPYPQCIAGVPTFLKWAIKKLVLARLFKKEVRMSSTILRAKECLGTETGLAIYTAGSNVEKTLLEHVRRQRWARCPLGKPTTEIRDCKRTAQKLEASTLYPGLIEQLLFFWSYDLPELFVVQALKNLATRSVIRLGFLRSVERANLCIGQSFVYGDLIRTIRKFPLRHRGCEDFTPSQPSRGKPLRSSSFKASPLTWHCRDPVLH